MFRAFSDRNRLRILCLLDGGELCVGDLVAILEIPQPRASRHLAYLKKAGLVIARKVGLWNYYSLANPVSDFHKNLIRCLANCFGTACERTSRHHKSAAASGTEMALWREGSRSCPVPLRAWGRANLS
jgi:DNA-binding transcriptional ArsR family regulator